MLAGLFATVTSFAPKILSAAAPVMAAGIASYLFKDDYKSTTTREVTYTPSISYHDTSDYKRDNFQTELMMLRLEAHKNREEMERRVRREKKKSKKMKKKLEKAKRLEEAKTRDIDKYQNELIRYPYEKLCEAWDKHSDGAVHIEGSFYRNRDGKLILRPKGFPPPNLIGEDIKPQRQDRITVIGKKVTITPYGMVHINRHRKLLDQDID